jgi:hypothetical protein
VKTRKAKSDECLVDMKKLPGGGKKKSCDIVVILVLLRNKSVFTGVEAQARAD